MIGFKAEVVWTKLYNFCLELDSAPSRQFY